MHDTDKQTDIQTDKVQLKLATHIIGPASLT